MIPYSRQSINKNDVKNVIKVLKSDYITQGKTVKKNLKIKFAQLLSQNMQLPQTALRVHSIFLV